MEYRSAGSNTQRHRSEMGALPPEEGAGNGDIARQAQRTVESDSQSKSDDGQPEADAVPQAHQRTGYNDTPADQSGDHNEPLKPQNRGGRSFSRTENFAFWTLLATAALAVATFVLALSTADMARSTRTLANLAGQQAHDTQTALATAARQASAAEESNNLAREPEISISQINIPTPVAGSPLTASFGVFDLGRTPASHVEGQAKVQILPVPMTAPALAQCVACGNSILFPSSGFQQNGLTYDSTVSGNIINASLVDAINKGTAVIYMTGRVDYSNAMREQHTIFI